MARTCVAQIFTTQRRDFAATDEDGTVTRAPRPSPERFVEIERPAAELRANLTPVDNSQDGAPRKSRLAAFGIRWKKRSDPAKFWRA